MIGLLQFSPLWRSVFIERRSSNDLSLNRAFFPLFLDEKWSKNQGFESFFIASLACPKFGRVISFVPQSFPVSLRARLRFSLEEF